MTTTYPSLAQHRPRTTKGPQSHDVAFLPLLGMCGTAVACGVAIAVDLRAAVVVAAVALAIATLHTRLWLHLTIVSLSGLVLLSWGFNNVPFPLGGMAVPLVDVLLIYALAASFRLWWPLATRTPIGRQLLGLLSILSLVTLLRLVADVPRFGVTAGRDALYTLEALGSACWVGCRLDPRSPPLNSSAVRPLAGSHLVLPAVPSEGATC